MLKVLLIILSLMFGTHHRGVVVAELYEGYAKNDDLYIVNIDGVYLPIVSDDFGFGDEMEIFVEDGKLNTWYMR